MASRNEAAFVENFLRSLTNQDFRGLSVETVIADGMSEDATRAILQQYSARHRWIRVVDNPRRIAAAGLNIALQRTSGEIVLRMDAHSEYAPNYVAECVAVLLQTRAANVGGPARIRSSGVWRTAIALAFRSPFYSGGARFHNPNYEGAVDTVPYGCWLRTTLEARGGFDEGLVRNQDDELNFRIRRAGGIIWQSPRIRSWYSPRSSWRALAQQYYEYGRWRVIVIRKHGRPAKWRQVVPAIALMAFLFLALGALLHPVFLQALVSALALYGAASAIASLAVLDNPRHIRVLAALPLVFGAVHISYSVGTLRGVTDWLLPNVRAICGKGRFPL